MLVPLSAFGENVEDSLIVGMISTRTTEIRPLTPQERDIVSLYGVVYESLVTVDDNGLPQPLLAESWTESGGGQTWTFTLRENITFSDGTPLTAQDVVASGQYILNLARASTAAFTATSAIWCPPSPRRMTAPWWSRPRAIITACFTA